MSCYGERLYGECEGREAFRVELITQPAEGGPVVMYSCASPEHLGLLVAGIVAKGPVRVTADTDWRTELMTLQADSP